MFNYRRLMTYLLLFASNLCCLGHSYNKHGRSYLRRHNFRVQLFSLRVDFCFIFASLLTLAIAWCHQICLILVPSSLNSNLNFLLQSNALLSLNDHRKFFYDLKFVFSQYFCLTSHFFCIGYWNRRLLLIDCEGLLMSHIFLLIWCHFNVLLSYDHLSSNLRYKSSLWSDYRRLLN